MADIERSGFDAGRDIFLLQSEPTTRTRAKLVWYIDFTGITTRRVRDLLVRAAERFAPQKTDLAVRFLPSGAADLNAEIAARAAIAAHQQGRFIEMYRALFSRPPRYSEALVIALAESLELNMDQFRADLHSDDTTDRLADDRNSAQRAGVHHMPTLFIDGREYDGAWDETSLAEAIEKPLGVRLQRATSEFFHWAASAGFVLVLATLAALILSNIGWHDAYEELRTTYLKISFGDAMFKMSLEHWINDCLMALFFLLVGIEIKREMVDGELSDMSRAMLPIMGAIGGMIVPAGIYVAINWGQDTAHGWGVPMATDIAFTLGIMALLGKRVPTSLKIFVSALAIADDLGAILVIAIFYGHGFEMDAFLIAVAIFAVMMGLNRGRVYARVPYIILGVFLWYFVYQSGLHATLAGVLTALAIPSRRSANMEGVAAQAAAVFDAEIQGPNATIGHGALVRLQSAIDRLRDPGFHLQHALENWSNFMILPLFAFFNTGILIIGSTFSPMAPEALGVMAGLLIGKPLGIFLIVWIAVKTGIAKMSPEINWAQIIGAGFLAGVGFTMSIFIGSAAFTGTQLESVKLSILIASTLAAVLGSIILILAAPRGANQS
ncbi:Na+/H+ antiporter NhaA [Aestuariibius sp. HNIBRBA575]|uniref:Na+/H+ antiporter NhaA n=1 Tax=Aestuariibius sp. HNIBRBA575 TaxID=3233343 RepID=UPI0034A2BFA0